MTTFNLGSLAGRHVYNSFVNSSNLTNSYTFQLTAPGSLNSSLTGLSADADLRLLNSSGTVVRSSTNRGTTSETIAAADLPAGSYSLQVSQVSGSPSYSLNVAADYAGNSSNTARNIGGLTTTKRTFSDFVGSSDVDDYYQLNLSNAGSLSVELNGQGGGASLQILNNSGAVIRSTSVADKDSGALNLNGLAAGTYYARVYSSSGNVNYNLSLANDVAIEPQLQNFLQSVHQTYYVNTGNTSASDQNPGTQALPFKTLVKAAEQAKSQNRAGQGVQILIAPGVYRESVSLSGEVGSTNAPIVVKAIQNGTVTISGSDVWTGWQKLPNENVYTHAWNYDWGSTPVTSWAADPLLFRHEVVFVNNQLLKQVVSRDRLVDGSFYVSESSNTLFIRPYSWTNMSTAEVEVSTRFKLMNIANRQNVQIEGLAFEHSGASAQDNAAVVFNNTRNILVQNTNFSWNNWSGLGVLGSENVVIRNVKANNNGEKGLSLYRTRNSLVENVEASSNNWRGDWVGFYGTDAGQKFSGLRNTVMRNYQAVNNLAKGLWLDYDNENFLIQNAFLKGNRETGIYLEANQGPISIRDSVMRENKGFGLMSYTSANVDVQRNKFINNSEYEVFLSNGGAPRQVTRQEGDKTYSLAVENWTFKNNTVVDQYKDDYLIRFNDPGTDLWNRFTRSYASDYNIYYHPGSTNLWAKYWSPNVFATLSSWQQITGKDKNSTFTLPQQL